MKKGLSEAVRGRIAAIEISEGSSITDAIERLYTVEGLSCNQIRSRWGLHYKQFNDLMTEYGIEKSRNSAVVRRIERIEGRKVTEALKDLYTVQGLSYRQLNERWGTQPATLIGLMKTCGIEPRKGGEAVAMQWVGNTARRAATARAMAATVKVLNESGRHPRLGQKNPGSGWWRSGATPAAREKQASTRKKMYAENPFMHPNAKAEPSVRELLMLEHCRAQGYVAEFSHSCHPYWIDIYLPELGVGIECVNTKRPTWERHCAITAQGIHMLYAGNGFIESGDFRQLDSYLMDFQEFRHQADFRSQDAVIWGSSYVFYFPDQPSDIVIEVLQVDGLHCLRYSTAHQ